MSTASAPATTTTTIIKQYITQPVIERTVQSAPTSLAGYVTQDELAAQIGKALNGTTYPAPSNYAQGGIQSQIALAQKIDTLTNTKFSNVTVHGLSGLTAADIPNDIVAGNYLPLAGGTLSGTLSGTDLTVSGNVSIGTTTPAEKLTVSGNGLLTGHVAIGNTAAVDSCSLFFAGCTTSSPLAISETMTDFSKAAEIGISNEINLNPSGAVSNFVAGIDTEVFTDPSNTQNIDFAEAGQSAFGHNGSGIITNTTGAYSSVNNGGSGTITSAKADYATVSNFGSGTITNGYGVFIESAQNAGGGTFTNNYGLYINDQSPATTGATNSFNLYSAGTGTNYFGGNIGIGTTTPWGKLSVTATDNAAIPQFVVGSSTAVSFIVDKSGNVGIGTTTPGYILSVESDTGTGGEQDCMAGWLAIGQTGGERCDNQELLKLGYNVAGDYGSIFAVHENSSYTPLVLQEFGGNVGIGTTTPQDNLSVYSANDGAGIGIYGQGETGITLHNSQNPSNDNWYQFIPDGGDDLIFGTDSLGVLTLTQAGNIGIGTDPATTLDVNGDITDENVKGCETLKTDTTGKLNCTSSDQRLKQDIASLDASSSLAAIEALDPVSFHWKNPTDGIALQLGFIAQAVEKTFPSLVSTSSPTALTPDGTLTFNYLGLIAPIVKAVQALDQKLSALADTVAGFADKFTTKKLCVGSTCLTESDLKALLEKEGVTGTPSNDSTTTIISSSTISGIDTTTPPTVTLMGNNPAHIEVGSDYIDVGVLAKDAADHDLSYRIFLNGTLVSNIVIDTSAVATDTIDYAATDTYGNTATSTRAVIIEAASSTAAAL